MSENSYAPQSLTMGHLSIKLRNLFISIPSCRRQIFHSVDILYTHTSFFKQRIFIKKIKLTLQLNSTKENYLAH